MSRIVLSVIQSPKSAKFSEKLELMAVQGHPRSSILVSIESAYATSYYHHHHHHHHHHPDLVSTYNKLEQQTLHSSVALAVIKTV